MTIKKRHGSLYIIERKKGTVTKYVYVNPQTGRKQFKFFGPTIPKKAIEAEIAKICIAIDAYKAGMDDVFRYGRDRIDNTTIGQLVDRFLADPDRKISIDHKTIEVARYVLTQFVDILGRDALIIEFAQGGPDYIGQYRTQLYELRRRKYIDFGKDLDLQKIKRGVNNALKEVRTLFNYAARKEWIQKQFVPEIEFYKVTKQSVAAALTEAELVLIENKLSGILRLAFQIFRYTGARRIEVVKDGVTGRGLRWRHIDWMRGTIELSGKGYTDLVPIHSRLHSKLKDRQRQLGEHYDLNDFIVPHSKDYVSKKFRKCMRDLGIWRSGFAVHVIRHSVGTLITERTGNQKYAQMILRHREMRTTDIYVHIHDGMKKAVEVL